MVPQRRDRIGQRSRCLEEFKNFIRLSLRDSCTCMCPSPAWHFHWQKRGELSILPTILASHRIVLFYNLLLPRGLVYWVASPYIDLLIPFSATYLRDYVTTPTFLIAFLVFTKRKEESADSLHCPSDNLLRPVGFPMKDQWILSKLRTILQSWVPMQPISWFSRVQYIPPCSFRCYNECNPSGLNLVQLALFLSSWRSSRTTGYAIFSVTKISRTRAAYYRRKVSSSFL